eukprot:scpid37289/ scgid24759/ ABC transporter B family member 1; ABC transporter ABCB.1
MYVVSFCFLLAVDCLAVVCTWITADKLDSDYFVDHITHFKFRTGILDAVVLALVRMAVCCACAISIEKLVKLSGRDMHNKEHQDNITVRRRVTGLVLGACALFFVVKLVMVILNQVDRHVPEHDKMDLFYLIGLSVTAGLCFLEIAVFAYGWRAMHRLRNRVILEASEDESREGNDAEGSDGKDSKKKKVDWKRMGSLMRRELELLLPGCFFLLLSTASTTLAPRFFGEVVDATSATNHAQAHVNKKILSLTVVFMVGAVAAMFRSYLFTLAGQRLVARIRIDLYKAIIDQEVAYFDLNRTGDLTNRLSSDTQVLQNALTVNISMLIRNCLNVMASMGFMMALSWKLTLVLLSIVPVIAIGAVQYGIVLKSVRKSFQEELGNASTAAEETISSIRTVRSFSNEDRSKDDYAKHIDKSYMYGKKLARAIASFTGVVAVISQGAIALVLWYGAKLVVDGHITKGILFSFMLYTITIAAAFATITSLYGDFMQAVGASTRIFELMDRQPEMNCKGGVSKDTLQGRIVFEDVHFTYPSRPETEVLKGLSFSVKPGTVVAMVGPSGGGKSTVVSLIERFYDPNSGTILLGDTKLDQLDPSWFRQHVALVGQEPVLFAYTIAENIAYGRAATREEIESAARKANAHDFITAFEDGYDTLVGERGVRLSGGQKQRVAIARALLMDPSILLLDEATSALDAESEFLVQDAIDRAMENRTVLVIAHRLSTVRNASKVLVMKGGCIVEEGTHDELIAINGVYKRLVLRQLAGKGDQDLLISGTGNALLGTKPINAEDDSSSEADVNATEDDISRRTEVTTSTSAALYTSTKV